MSAPGRRVCARAAGALLLGVLAACGTAGAGPGVPTLTWYVRSDSVDAVDLARTCTAEARGAYTIRIERLPADVDARHDQLVRRLTAKDTSIDLLSLDTAFTAELSAARLLAPVPEDRVPRLSKGIAPAALAAATYDGQLVVAPWWLDPQLLWFRGNVAERAGLDTSAPISWEDLVAGAQRLGVTIQIADRDGSGLADWVNALIVGGGGELIKGAGRDAAVGLDSQPGRTAASIVELYLQSALGPGPAVDALKAFTAPDGGFLLAPSSIITDPALAAVAADMGWTAYPAVADTSIAPLSGAGLAVPLYAPHSDLSFDAIDCLTSPAVMTTLMIDAGHSSSRLTTYDDRAVTASYPMAEVTKAAVLAGATVPVTPYWNVARLAIDDTWSPLEDFSQDETLTNSQRAVRAALAGELP